MKGTIMRRRNSLVFLKLVSLATLIFLLSGCPADEMTTPPGPSTALAAVTNLRAYSKNAITVGLTWTASTDAGNSDFQEYQITTKVGSTVAAASTVSKSETAREIMNLVEGVIYTFEVVGVASSTSQTYVNSDTVTIQWSPARRLDMEGAIDIEVYEIQSQLGGSGLQFYDAASGGPRVLSIAASQGFQQDIDVLLDTLVGGTIILESAHLNPLLVGQARATAFSSIDTPADSLNVGQQSPPDLSTYDRDYVVIGSGAVATGKIFYAISSDSNYVRILVERDPTSGTLLFDSSPDQVARAKLSYQGVAGVPFAKQRP